MVKLFFSFLKSQRIGLPTVLHNNTGILPHTYIRVYRYPDDEVFV